MSSIPSPAAQRVDRPRRSLRWIALLLASILLHVLVFNWADGRLALPALRKDQPAVITTELRAAPAPAETPAPAAPARRPKPRRAAPLPPDPAPVPVADTVAALPTAEVGAPDTAAEPATTPASAEPAIAQEEAAAGNAQPEANTPPTYKVDPPPSAQLRYDVQSLREGKQWYGSGMFQWESSGNRYSITGEASVTFLFKITVLNFRSEGVINGFGVAPMLYSEKPWRKSMTNTHFLPEQQKISFSASEAVYPYKGGEQDRASIMWQLASIGRGDASQIAPGAMLDIVVAGARKAETWRIQVIGQEQIDTPFGSMSAWHVLRTPVEGSYDQKIEFWLAPQHEWYPVKLRFTYANGDYLDMALSALTRTAPQ